MPPSARRWQLRRARAGEADEVARVQTDGWRDSFRGLMPDKVLDGPLLEHNCALWRRMFRGEGGQFGDMGFPWLAVDAAGRMIGFSAFGPVRGSDWGHDAEVYALYVETRWQGWGIGRALMRQTAIGLKFRKRRSLLLWALEANHKARAFYEHLGGRKIDRETHCFSGVWLPEVAYEWPDLAGLIDGGGRVSSKLAAAQRRFKNAF